MRAREETIAANERSMQDYLDQIDDLKGNSACPRRRASAPKRRPNVLTREAADLRVQVRGYASQVDQLSSRSHGRFASPSAIRPAAPPTSRRA